MNDFTNANAEETVFLSILTPSTKTKIYCWCPKCKKRKDEIGQGYCPDCNSSMKLFDVDYYIKDFAHRKDYCFPTPKHIRVMINQSEVIMEFSINLNQEIEVGDLCNNMMLMITNDPTSHSALASQSIGYHWFKIAAGNCRVISNNPLTIKAKASDCVYKECFNYRSNYYDDVEFKEKLDWKQYKNLLGGDFSITDYFFQSNHTKRFVKVYSHYYNDLKKGELLIFSMNPENCMNNIGVLQHSMIDDLQQLAQAHESIIDGIINNIEKQGEK